MASTFVEMEERQTFVLAQVIRVDVEPKQLRITFSLGNNAVQNVVALRPTSTGGSSFNNRKEPLASFRL